MRRSGSSCSSGWVHLQPAGGAVAAPPFGKQALGGAGVGPPPQRQPRRSAAGAARVPWLAARAQPWLRPAWPQPPGPGTLGHRPQARRAESHKAAAREETPFAACASCAAQAGVGQGGAVDGGSRGFSDMARVCWRDSRAPPGATAAPAWPRQCAREDHRARRSVGRCASASHAEPLFPMGRWAPLCDAPNQRHGHALVRH